MTDIRGTQKSHKSEPKSNKFLDLAKIFQIPFFNEINKAPKKTPKKVAYKHKKANDSLGILSGILDQSEENKEKSPSNKKNLFRIE